MGDSQTHSDTGNSATFSTTREARVAALSLLTGALIWGLIWYPYRILRDAGLDGVVASTATYSVAFLLGLFFFRHSLTGFRPTWSLFWLALAAGGCNLGYVMATLSGEVVRVLLLFYLAPLWTVLLARLMLRERLNRIGVAVVLLSLCGAATMLWEPRVGWPVPQDAADWLGLGAGFFFALFNVLSRQTQGASIEIKSMSAFAGVFVVGALLIAAGIGQPRMPDGASSWLLVILIGCVLVVVNLVVQYGLSRVAANRAIVIMLSEIGFAARASWLLAGEALGLRELSGGAMILLASVYSARMGK
jgi:drug/metabolite transporter (DMT)-like permease